jgi:leucyl-tRNA synthetase
MIDRYDPQEIEEKWRRIWEKNKTFKTDLKKAKKPFLDRRSQDLGRKPKFYNLMMFPYPSGEGLHVGHVYAFGGSDTFGRLKRMQGHDVFEPMGFDSFGIHSENYAINKKIHPKDLIEKTTTNFREKQLKKLGALFDWDHQVITSDADYYRWTQWLFIQLFKSGLAVRKKAPVDWCPSCKTVLADEQVIAGKCERCSHQVIQKELEQWFFKITDYAQRLLDNLDKIDWSETTKTMQRNWIGRSDGLIEKWKVDEMGLELETFTTWPHTTWGATFMVIAPEHPIIKKLVKGTKYESGAKKFIEEVKKDKIKDPTNAEKEKKGFFLGRHVVNHLAGHKMPLYIANFAIMGYGTGIVKCTPTHDQRDFEFAKKYDLPMILVVRPKGSKLQPKDMKEAYVGSGVMTEDTGKFEGMTDDKGREAVANYSIKLGHARKETQYHLRDWLISRQRYWGPPIPMIYCESCADEGKSWFDIGKSNKKPSEGVVGWYPVPEKDLPVKLPHVENYHPEGSGVSPLASLPSFANVECPGCGKKARRETDVSDTFLDSSWYFLRYPSVGLPNANKEAFNKKMTEKWLPVDMYIGGNEHAVMHLLYTRFITMALRDAGLLSFEEPFKKFRAHGLIIKEGAKMSKSRGNVVNPNEFLDTYGADALRMYLLFIGPYDLGGDFSDRAITGVYRFLSRVWQAVLEISNSPTTSANKNVAKQLNKVVKKVSEDSENLKFNTAIATLMEFLNFVVKHKKQVDGDTLKKFVTMLSIYAPFTAEELWNRISGSGSVHDQSWPGVEEKYPEEESTTVVVQVDGKLRDTLKIEIEKSTKKDEVEGLARKSDRVASHLRGKKIAKVVYVPGKIVNFVTGK